MSLSLIIGIAIGLDLVGLVALIFAGRDDAFADTARPDWPFLDHSEVP